MSAVPLYGGALQAHKIGSFLKKGHGFSVIRPGYCIQGKRRIGWTQVVHEDVPIFTVKAKVNLQDAMAKFDELWDAHIEDDIELFLRALEACKAEHRAKFRDGRSGVPAAPSLVKDGFGEGHRYPA